MAAVFPPVAKVVFCYIEPLTLLAGIIAPAMDTAFFATSQIPSSRLTVLQRLPGYEPAWTERTLALQLSNTFALALFLGVGVLNTTREARVAHAYVLALWLADIGHLAVTAYGMGTEAALDVGSWNATAWGNLGITTTLFLVRTAYGFGLLGPDRDPLAEELGEKSGSKTASKRKTKSG